MGNEITFKDVQEFLLETAEKFMKEKIQDYINTNCFIFHEVGKIGKWNPKLGRILPGSGVTADDLRKFKDVKFISPLGDII